MPFQSWTTLLNAPAPGAGAAYNTSTSATDVSPAPQFTIPANFLMVGSVLEVWATGTFSNTGTPNLTLGVYYGGVAGTSLAKTGATATTTAATSWTWTIFYRGTVRSIGSSGTIMGAGYVQLGTSLTALTHIPIDAAAQAAVTIDTTTAKVLSVGATWGTNNASNTLTCQQFHVSSEA